MKSKSDDSHRVETMSEELHLPKGIRENLEPGEDVKNIVETFSVMGIPEVLAVTDRRVLYLKKRIFGRYDFQSIPYMKMRNAYAKTGKVVWGEFFLEGEEENKIHLDRVKRENIASTFKSMIEAINAIAVEPLSIRHKRGILGEDWALSKPPEMVMRGVTTATNETDDDPLRILKIRYAKGEINQEEYEKMKKNLEV